MKRFLAVWIACGALGARTASAQTAGDLFDGSVLQEFRLTMNPADWQRLHDNYQDKKTNYKCDFLWHGLKVSGIGLHTRGTGSLNPIKPGLGIEFNKFTASQTFLGMASLILRNFSQDPSGLHDRLTMQVFARMGLPHQRTAHVRLVVNEQYVGLYELVEPIDSRYLITRFGEDNGYLYEAKGGMAFHFQYLGTDPAAYVPVLFDPKTHSDAPQGDVIAEMVRTANLSTDAEFKTSMSRFMDLGGFVAHVAVEVFMGESDGILSDSGMTNYYLYRRLSDDRWSFLPWDKEMTFVKPDWSIWQFTDDNVLLRRALQVPELRQRYLDTLHQVSEMIGGSDGWLRQEVEREFRQVEQSMLNDPSRVCVVNGVFDHCPSAQFGAAMDYLRGFAQERAAFVNMSIQSAGWRQDARVPDLRAGKIVNAASGVPVLSPGELVYIEAVLPVSQTERAKSWPLPTEIAGVWASVNGVRAPMLLASPTGVWIVTPVELPCGPASITLHNSTGGSHTTAVEIHPAAPGIFAVTHASGALVEEASPAIAGEVLVVWATGLGHAAIDPPSGQPAPLDRLIQTKDPVTATFGGSEASVLWAGLAPGYAGLYQVVVRLPATLVGSGASKLVLAMFGEAGAGVIVPVW